MKRTALVIRKPACNSEMTLSANYYYLQGRSFLSFVRFSALGKSTEDILGLLLQFFHPLTARQHSIFAPLNYPTYTESATQLHEIEPGHNFLLMAANSSPLLTKHGYFQHQKLEMRPTSTIGTAYFSITDCTVNLSLSRAVTGRDNAISRHHLKNGKESLRFQQPRS